MYIRNSSLFSCNKEEVATWRGVSQKGSCETGLSCGKDWREKDEDIVLGDLPRSYRLFVGQKIPDNVNLLRVVVYLQGTQYYFLFPFSFCLLFLLLTWLPVEPHLLVLGPLWLGLKKEMTSVGPLLYVRYFKSLITSDPVQ